MPRLTLGLESFSLYVAAIRLRKACSWLHCWRPFLAPYVSAISLPVIPGVRLLRCELYDFDRHVLTNWILNIAPCESVKASTALSDPPQVPHHGEAFLRQRFLAYPRCRNPPRSTSARTVPPPVLRTFCLCFPLLSFLAFHPILTIPFLEEGICTCNHSRVLPVSPTYAVATSKASAAFLPLLEGKKPSPGERRPSPGEMAPPAPLPPPLPPYAALSISIFLWGTGPSLRTHLRADRSSLPYFGGVLEGRPNLGFRVWLGIRGSSLVCGRFTVSLPFRSPCLRTHQLYLSGRRRAMASAVLFCLDPVLDQ